jgi:hypothetical protein
MGDFEQGTKIYFDPGFTVIRDGSKALDLSIMQNRLDGNSEGKLANSDTEWPIPVECKRKSRIAFQLHGYIGENDSVSITSQNFEGYSKNELPSNSNSFQHESKTILKDNFKNDEIVLFYNTMNWKLHYYCHVAEIKINSNSLMFCKVCKDKKCEESQNEGNSTKTWKMVMDRNSYSDSCRELTHKIMFEEH